ncbi:rab11 family-interacting protein 2-like [Hemicordylus capensis]|uniref:rab11 family-interacting protein 2-like n=1 Tax=Hemicordylus capensis TaxID=884348 RepID=UPI002303480A|nr:rab11 family-interacting protein 2-like [Hemicordylus capensis]
MVCVCHEMSSLALDESAWMELDGNQEATRSLPVIGVDEDKEEKEWHPTHLRTTVLRACSLRPKGTTGTSHAYVVIQLQKQKFRTSTAPPSLSPEWQEECILQLPSVLDDSEEQSLILTVMHQSLHHFNQFLGRVCLPLAQLFQDKTKRRNEWFVLQSRPGKKEKMRGQLQLSLQFLQISSPPSEPALNSRGPWSLFTRFYGSKKSRRYKVYKEAPSNSSSLTNDEDSSSSSMNPELEAAAEMSGSRLGSSLHMVAATTSGRKTGPSTQMQKLIPYNYKELPSDAGYLTAHSPSISQSEHPSTLEQFGSIFSQTPKKKSKPLKEERSPEAAGICMEAWQTSLPSLHVAGPSGIAARAQTVHISTVSLHQTTHSPTASSLTSHFRRCQLRLHRSCQFCLQCLGQGSSSVSTSSGERD